MNKTFKLKDVQPNPFRDFEVNPLNAASIEGLKTSYEKEGDFGKLVVRIRNGKPQLHCGHHRLEALKLLYSEYVFEVEEIDDAKMLTRMVVENSERKHDETRRIVEAVQGAVRAYSEGNIALNGDISKAVAGSLRIAPSFILDKRKFTELEPEEQAKAWTPKALACFLGADMVKGAENKPEDRFMGVVNGLTLNESKL